MDEVFGAYITRGPRCKRAAAHPAGRGAPEEAVAGFRAGGLAEEELVTLALLDAWQMAVQGRNAPCSRPAAILVAALEQLGSDRARLPWGAPAPTPGV